MKCYESLSIIYSIEVGPFLLSGTDWFQKNYVMWYLRTVRNIIFTQFKYKRYQILWVSTTDPYYQQNYANTILMWTAQPLTKVVHSVATEQSKPVIRSRIH